jgi:hypothetical protein
MRIRRRRHHRTWIGLAFGCLLSSGILMEGCGEDRSNAPPDGATGGPSVDGPGGDAATTDTNEEDVDQGFDPPEEDGGTGPRPQRVSPATCPYALAVHGGFLYWTETNAQANCSSNDLRRCALATGCASLPKSIYRSSGTLWGLAGGDPESIYFTGGDQLLKMRVVADASAPQPVFAAFGAGAVVTQGTNAFFAADEGLYRVAFGASNVELALGGPLGYAVSESPQAIAVDPVRAYGAPEGALVRACPVGTSCAVDASAATTILSYPEDNGIASIASDGVHVFATQGKRFGYPGPERLLRCPSSGCSGAVPEVMSETFAPDAEPGQGNHIGLALDETYVYWGTVAGTIYFCRKDAPTPCTPTALVASTKPLGMLVEGPHLYWADGRGAIYRIRRPSP